MTPRVDEDAVEQAVIGWLKDLGYSYVHGPDMAPGGKHPERPDFETVALETRFRDAIERLNPTVPREGLEQAIRAVLRPELPTGGGNILNNQRFHHFLRDGVDVEYPKEGRLIGDKVWLFDFEDPDRNDWLVANQVTVKENGQPRRADVVVYVNGLPLALFELKNPGDENATLRDAYNQIQTYKLQVPSLFAWNEVVVISDGLQARHGTLSSDFGRFMPWRSIDSGEPVKEKPQIEVLLRGMFEKRRFLDLVRNFVLFEADPTLVKKMAAYHQFHAVNRAVEATVRASGPQGDKRVGVVWHTQGSGKSISMVFYSAKIQRHPAMQNPTLVVLTDRNDLDDQLLGTFAQARELLGEPRQAEDRPHLKELLKVASGGIVFTTIQKFAPDEKGTKFPTLSERRNIVVIADEAHRSQYDFIDGFARNLRDGLSNASFIAFTGTPIEMADRSTRSVFGDYIDVYDMQRAVADDATVRIYFESRLVPLNLKPGERELLDQNFEDVTEGQEEAVKRKLKTKWARLEAIVGAPARIDALANDLVQHFENRTSTLEGKAMVVCMSRRICVELYEAIRKIRPAWHDEDDARGAMKVVMTGDATDPLEFQPHIRSKQRRKALQGRVKDPDDPLKLVIVRDMWLTGFDAPVLHTMYLDKPMKGHTLMQAIARVNRVWKDKTGGLIVEYFPVADSLRRAMEEYSEGSRREAGIPIETAVSLLKEKHDVVSAILHGLNYETYSTGGYANQLQLLQAGLDRVLSSPELKERFIQATTELRRAFGLAGAHERAAPLRDDVHYFLDLRAQILKHTVTNHGDDDLDSAIRLLVGKAIATDKVIDVFEAAGLKKPDISILSDEFLAEIKAMPYRNLAMELLQRLLNDEVKARQRRNIIEGNSFRELLERTITRYRNRAIEAAQVIDELVGLAKDMRAAHERGEQLGLTDVEVAFYDALSQSQSARDVLGDEALRTIAREVVKTIRDKASIDWTLKESVRADLRRSVKRVLQKHGFPPDQAKTASDLVLEQATMTCANWPEELEV